MRPLLLSVAIPAGLLFAFGVSHDIRRLVAGRRWRRDQRRLGEMLKRWECQRQAAAVMSRARVSDQAVELRRMAIEVLDEIALLPCREPDRRLAP